jgi:hypothetical protein
LASGLWRSALLVDLQVTTVAGLDFPHATQPTSIRQLPRLRLLASADEACRDSIRAMLRVGAQTELRAIDFRPLVAALPALARRWRGLRFDQGVYVDAADGRRREGLRIEHGAHPLAGTSYRLVLRSEQPPEPTEEARAELVKLMERNGVDHHAAFQSWFRRGREAATAAGQMEAVFTTTLVELLADDRDRIRVRVQDPGARQVEEIELYRPDRPERISVDVTGRVEGGWLTRGPITAHISLALDQLPPAEGSAPQFVAELHHRRAQGKAEARIRAADGRSWSIAVDVGAMGRGLTRPIVAVLAPLARRYARHQLDALIAQLPVWVNEFNRVLHEDFGAAPDPEQMADKLLDEFLDDVVEHVPPSPQPLPQG